MRATTALLSAILAFGTSASWAEEESAAAMPTVPTGDWRIVVDTPIGELPFNMELARDGDTWTATFINGPERMEAEVTSVLGTSLVVEFPSYGHRIAGAVVKDGTMQGVIQFNRPTGTTIIPFVAGHGQSHRFFSDTIAPAQNLDGRWAMSRVNEAYSPEPTHGLLELSDDDIVVVGASMVTTGDSRFLTGELRGNDLYMSTFYGGAGALWRGTLNEDGTLSGQSYSLSGGFTTDWSAKRDATAALDDATKLTYIKDGYDSLEFSFPDLDGNMVSLSDPRFDNKVVVVTIGGSWCPTCHDETAFFSPYFNENKERGLEAIGLMYEYSPEFDKAVRACRRYVSRYDVQYPMLIAGQMDKEAAAKTLPMINAVLVYPTMIIVDRTGEVRHIHTGFPGPATGEHHEEFKSEFYKLMDELLAEDV
ncbi:MAG: TlpA family protein disulfide reductase [Rhodospirillaceae bacterium]|jgi:peroxiredoxin|nr:TlpA family protein disulfide reductase [Rhodospirillaceae bacterium]MBT5566262.1 TlpA family protein disulfide reductase [Rhodospirillaceae bacterium]MBT6089043.1 TlpA family protein disulfide reductase [Rhodospirillaceae bacterium]MBT7450453.1 TlpA family protein disulfide reductase [Rhodospirillaceae bacterium]